jgi:hypothetical protein
MAQSRSICLKCAVRFTGTCTVLWAEFLTVPANRKHTDAALVRTIYFAWENLITYTDSLSVI